MKHRKNSQDELFLVGALFHSSDNYELVSQWVSKKSFSDPTLGAIYHAIITLYYEGKPPTAANIHIHTNGAVPNIHQFIHSHLAIEDPPWTASNVLQYAHAVTVADLKRRITSATTAGNWQEVSDAARLLDSIRHEELSPKPSIVAATALEILKMNVPARTYIMRPWLAKQDLVMIHGWRGSGKTQLSLAIAATVAAGAKFSPSWQSSQPRMVLYIDGELPLYVIQNRLAIMGQHLCHNEEQANSLVKNLSIITQDLQQVPLPNLSTPKGQSIVKKATDAADLIIVDNLSSLCGDSPESDDQAWFPIAQWLLTLRRQGKTVIIVHHSGKAGQQRGTSKREDILDYVIKVTRSDDYTEGNAQFEVCFEKDRHRNPPAADGSPATQPFEAKLEGHRWYFLNINTSKKDQLQELLDGEGANWSTRRLATELNVSPMTIGRWRKGLGK